MIAFHNPEDQTPVVSQPNYKGAMSWVTPNPLPAPLFDTQSVAAKIAKAHAELTSMKLTEALIARFGKMPSPEEIAAHVVCGVDQDKVSHYVWVEVKPLLGETMPMDDILCSIAPPKIFNPEKP